MWICNLSLHSYFKIFFFNFIIFLINSFVLTSDNRRWLKALNQKCIFYGWLPKLVKLWFFSRKTETETETAVFTRNRTETETDFEIPKPNSSINWSVDRLISWPVGRRLASRLVGRLVSWLIGRMDLPLAYSDIHPFVDLWPTAECAHLTYMFETANRKKNDIAIFTFDKSISNVFHDIDPLLLTVDWLSRHSQPISERDNKTWC